MARILSAYDKSIFELSKNFTKVTFKFTKKVAIKSGDKKVAIKSGDKKTSKKYEEQKSAVIEYLTTKKSAKSEEFVEVLEVKISRVKIILKRMVEDGVIATDGGNRNRIYMLK
jgi:hypothetical protein